MDVDVFGLTSRTRFIDSVRWRQQIFEARLAIETVAFRTRVTGVGGECSHRLHDQNGHSKSERLHIESDFLLCGR